MTARDDSKRHLALCVSILLFITLSPFVVLVARLVGLHIVHGLEKKS